MTIRVTENLKVCSLDRKCTPHILPPGEYEVIEIINPYGSGFPSWLKFVGTGYGAGTTYLKQLGIIKREK
jgi:hypothetical protein